MKPPLPDEINPKLWYGTSQASRLLGIDPKTVNVKAKLGAMNGGLDFRINRSNNRKEFQGKELLRYLYGEPYDPKPWRKYQKLGAR